jgi:anti-sigma factor RsiW
MRCDEAGDLLLELLDGGLDAAAASEVEAHLHGCARCAASREDLRAALALLHMDVVPEPPPGTWERFGADVRAKIRLAEEAAVGRQAAPVPHRPRSARPRPGIWERLLGWTQASTVPPLAVAAAAAVLLAIGVARTQPAPSEGELVMARDLEVLWAADAPEDLELIERLPALLRDGRGA